MAFADPVVSEADLVRYYSSELEFRLQFLSGDSVTGPEPGNPWELDRLRTVAQTIAESFPERNARVLDVGCGSGALLAFLRELGFHDLVGIEPSPGSVDLGQRLGLEIRAGSLAALPGDLGTFDCIVISHVLEHLESPSEALQTVAPILGSQGMLYVEVPDAIRFAELAKLPFAEFNTEHINYFSPRSLQSLLRRNGFACVRIETKAFSLLPGIPYPAVFGLWRLDGSRGRDETVQDESLRARIDDYIQVSQVVARRIDEGLAAILGDRKEVIVRCLGNLAWTLLEVTCLRDLQVRAYVDGSPIKQRLTIDGCPILSPNTPISGNLPVVVLSLQHENAVIKEIREREPGRVAFGVSAFVL
jgi:SAM-dependent methyltransferase